MTVLSVTKTTHLLCTVQICITSKIFVKMNSFGGWIWLNCRLGTSSRQAVWLGVLYLWFPVFTASLSDWMCSLRPPSLLNAVPALTLKGKNVTSAGWQVTPCDPMWRVSSRSGVATLRTAIHLLLTYEQLCNCHNIIQTVRNINLYKKWLKSSFSPKHMLPCCFPVRRCDLYIAGGHIRACYDEN